MRSESVKDENIEIQHVIEYNLKCHGVCNEYNRDISRVKLQIGKYMRNWENVSMKTCFLCGS